MEILPQMNYSIYNLKPIKNYQNALIDDLNLNNFILKEYKSCDIIFDYSEINLNNYNENIKNKIIYLPTPLLYNNENKYLYSNDINFKKRKIDILYFGETDERINEILDNLNEFTGLNIVILKNDLEYDLYSKIQKSKIALFLNNNENKLLDTIKINKCLRKHEIFIICEKCHEKDEKLLKLYENLIDFIPEIKIDNIDFLNLLIETIYKIINFINESKKYEINNNKKNKIKNVFELNKYINSKNIFLNYINKYK